MRASPTVHFPLPLYIYILHPNQRTFVTMVPWVGVGIGLSCHFRQRAGHIVCCATDTAGCTAIRLANIRGVFGAVFAVETVVAFTIRAVAFGRKVGEAEDGVFAQEVVDGFQRGDARANYQKEKLSAGPGGEIISCPCDALARTRCFGR